MTDAIPIRTNLSWHKGMAPLVRHIIMLSNGKRSIDEIAFLLHHSVSEIAAILSELYTQGYIEVCSATVIREEQERDLQEHLSRCIQSTVRRI